MPTHKHLVRKKSPACLLLFLNATMTMYSYVCMQHVLYKLLTNVLTVSSTNYLICH